MSDHEEDRTPAGIARVVTNKQFTLDDMNLLTKFLNDLADRAEAKYRSRKDDPLRATILQNATNAREASDRLWGIFRGIRE